MVVDEVKNAKLSQSWNNAIHNDTVHQIQDFFDAPLQENKIFLRKILSFHLIE